MTSLNLEHNSGVKYIYFTNLLSLNLTYNKYITNKTLSKITTLASLQLYSKFILKSPMMELILCQISKK